LGALGSHDGNGQSATGAPAKWAASAPELLSHGGALSPGASTRAVCMDRYRNELGIVRQRSGRGLGACWVLCAACREGAHHAPLGLERLALAARRAALLLQLRQLRLQPRKHLRSTGGGSGSARPVALGGGARRGQTERVLSQPALARVATGACFHLPSMPTCQRHSVDASTTGLAASSRSVMVCSDLLCFCLRRRASGAA
jgi:hypothetical protein